MTMLHNLHGNSTCDRFKHMLHDLLKTLDKKKTKPNRPLHISPLVFAYNAMPHSVTSNQSYELMFSYKVPTVCSA